MSDNTFYDHGDDDSQGISSDRGQLHSGQLPVPAPIPTSSVMYRLGGRTYPMKAVKGCFVCRSPYRAVIENHLILGYSYEQIAENLPEEAGIDYVHIRNHYKGGGTGSHLPLAEDSRRALIEKRASELQWDPEHEAQRLDDHISFLRLGVHDVMSRMATRQIQPDIKDGIAMANALAKIDLDKETEDSLGQYVAAIKTLLELARESMDNDQFKVFSSKILQNETMRSLMSRPVPKAISQGEE